MEAIRAFLVGHPYFRALRATELAQVAQQAMLRTLARGEMLALEGDECRTVYFVVQGRMRALKMSLQGREQIISELCAGQSFYLAPALDGGLLPVSTQAVTRVTLLSFTRCDFLVLLQTYPGVAMHVLVDFANRLRQLTSLVEDLALRPIPQRLAKLLLEQAQTPEGPHLTQREMAARLGTVREVLARALGQFERQGWIRLRRGVIEIVDTQALQQLAAGEYAPVHTKASDRAEPLATS